VSRAAVALRRYRIEEADARRLAGLDPPAWVYLHGTTSPLSSSLLRRRKPVQS
jgi:nicotinate-nucleotide adenylyltransferase